MSGFAHWVVLPVVVPMLAAALALVLGPTRRGAQAVVSVAAVAILLWVGLRLVVGTSDGTVLPYLLGNWRAPFGIVLVADGLSATMLLLAAVLAAAALAYALIERSDTDRGGPVAHAYFHPLFLFQLTGINGAFLTGDLFNLFVFFEVLLIASYGLLLHGVLDARAGDAPGAPGRRMTAAFQYVVYNLVGSALFLVGVSLIYGVTGTLNMADLAVRVPQVAPADRPLLEAGALILLVVFCIKGALLPLNAWLPATYAAAGVPAATLFAVLTKVGVYCVARVFTLAFGAGAGASAGLADGLLLVLGIGTVAAGALGVLAAREPARMAGWFVIGSSGTLLAALGFADARITAGALYYLLDSTLAASAFFMLVGLMRVATSAARMEPVGAGLTALGLAFFVVAMMLAGLPPLAGFLGKFILLSAALGGGAQGDAPGVGSAWLAGVVLLNGLAAIVALSRVGSRTFWKGEARLQAPGRAAVLPLAIPLSLAVALMLFAGPVSRHVEAVANALYAPRPYLDAVLRAQPVPSPPKAYAAPLSAPAPALPVPATPIASSEPAR